ncbi:MAG: ABC transporter permease [Myxococcota bacterium]|nr:ABC transporter permease [Myxococcota bacterium]MDW8360992.1 ABC transporter permease [Myxococcales bacterium]
MTRYVLRRLAWALFVVWAALSLVFVLVHGVGDPAAATLGPRAGAEQLREFRRKHGLDRPLLEQYARYVAGVVRGDLGTSFRDEQPVSRVIATRLPRTLLLGALALAFELVIGLGLGIFAALRRNTIWDTGTVALTFVGISAPTFVTGLVFLYVFAFLYGWFPVGGYGVDALDHLRHAILPAFTLAIFGAATYARLMRSEMVEVLGSDYVRTARAKGASRLRAALAHAARNAMLPVVVLVGLQLSTLVSGAIITEQIYAWPGMGRLAFEAISALDAPLVLGVVLVTAATVQAGNLLADIAIAALDPRVRMTG